jgi:hypothetical protein
VTERGIPGRHGEFDIVADGTWLEHIERVRESGRQYRPASPCNRPSVEERPRASGKKHRSPAQLKLNLRKAHAAFLAKVTADQSASQISRATSEAGKLPSMP